MTSDRSRHRLERKGSATLRGFGEDDPRHKGMPLKPNAVVDCGWGRLVFAHTFGDNAELARTLLEEEPGRRDIGLYLRDPHVVLAMAPQELFLDPSHTYRLWFHKYLSARVQPRGFRVRRLRDRKDAEAIYNLLNSRRMVPPDPDFIMARRKSRTLSFFVAEDEESGHIIGTVTGVDHVHAFGDPEKGSSMWCLAVDPQAAQPGIGRALVALVADHYSARGRAFMDLSVMHDNEAVIRLYEKMGFERVPVFSMKRKNAINEPLFVGPETYDALNPYARILVDEARRRGIGVELVDAEEGYFALTLGGRSIICRESLTELTSAIAMSRCDDKRITRKVLAAVGLEVPAQRMAGEADADEAFLREHGRIVVKPARGEQGNAVAVDITEPADMVAAIEAAARTGSQVILEAFAEGEDLRIVLIDYEVVAAALRRPAEITGDGQHDIRTLIEKQSRRRAAATGGESRIPLDGETTRCIVRQGHALEDVLPLGETLQVRDTANLHTGGTLHDVTDALSPALRAVAERAARALSIPVVGLDLLVPDPAGDEYVIIEANERPGLANHEPQPTAERFVDFLFPQTVQVNDDATVD
ncbi:N-acetylglutaminylglutamine synthetase [Wenzhouxiangella sp. XN24]|uniref:N-acetylglutaminylglutamine synthetase n=1 Tax=Wenzhouxiangella sp. XN24 TaxID=2713569 RepID=UPI0013ED1597|nr:N-acetylglutaminylglutamine synthetase [Wenzhouxiangella sp. XN24]NGX16638.1 N-acetylglutaminylglutamine synthetase [Wenzhouxiangella sp. XN24]